MNLHLTYFGDNNFSIGKNRIRSQAENFGVFKTILEYGEEDLKNNEFWETHAKKMMGLRSGSNKRYYGYYASRMDDTLAGWTYTRHTNSICLTPPEAWKRIPEVVNVNWYKRPIYYSDLHDGYFISNSQEYVDKVEELGALVEYEDKPLAPRWKHKNEGFHMCFHRHYCNQP